MNNGLCPLCKNVIPSNSQNCPACGSPLSINLIPKAKRVPYKYVGGPRMVLTALTAIASACMGGAVGGWAFDGELEGIYALLLVVGLGFLIAACCVAPAINRQWLQLCLEDSYRKNAPKEATQRNSSKGSNTTQKNDTNKENEQRDVSELAKSLTELKSLLDSGVISEEEYNELKKELLSKK